jgi:uncharacterized protein YihD (DUF1040 family)
MLDFADLEFNKKWNELLNSLNQDWGRKPDLNAILFLIGVQELGKGKQNFTKEEKQDLMHIAICKLLSQIGYFELVGIDKDGWPHWKQVIDMPVLNLLEQEKLLKMQVLEYFQSIE